MIWSSSDTSLEDVVLAAGDVGGLLVDVVVGRSGAARPRLADSHRPVSRPLLGQGKPPRAPSYRVVTEFLRGPPCRFRIEAEHSWLFTEGISVGDLSEATVSDAREGCFFLNTFPVIFFSPFRLESKRTIIDDDDGPMAALQGLFASIINHTLCGAWPPSSTHANRFLF